MDALLSVRARLDTESAKLLDQVAAFLEAAGVLEVLLDQLETLAAHGLVRREVSGSDGELIVVFGLAPGAELLLREYVAICGYDKMTVAEKRTLMLRMARLAGYA